MGQGKQGDVGVNRERVIDGLKKYKVPLVVLAIFSIGFAIRYQSAGPRLSALDPWHWHLLVELLLEKGYMPERNMLAYYPEGSALWSTDNLFFPFFIAYTYRAIEPLGITLMEYMVAFPAIFGALSCVTLFFLVRELFDFKIASLSALLYTAIPGALTRVSAGFCDKESLASFFMYLWMFFFIKAYKSNGNDRKIFGYSVLAGLCFFSAYGTWSGSGQVSLIISTATFVYLLILCSFKVEFFEKVETLLKAILIMTVVGVALLGAFQPLRYPMFIVLFNDITMVGLGFISMCAVCYFVIKYIKNIEKIWKHKHRNSIVVLFTLSIFYIIGFETLWDMFKAVVVNFERIVVVFLLNPRASGENIYMATVAESQRTHFLGGGDTIIKRIMSGHWFQFTNVALFGIPFAMCFLVRGLKNKLSYTKIFCLVWICSGMLAIRMGFRLSFFLSAPTAVAASYALLGPYTNCSNRLGDYGRRLEKTRKPRLRKDLQEGIVRQEYLQYFYMFLILCVTLSVMNVGVHALKGRRSDVPPSWYDAMMWVQTNTPEDAVLFSWWDYGYWFQGVGKRASIADGGANVPRNIDLAHMFTSPEDEAMKYIEKYVNYTEVPTYMIVSVEELGKSSAINHIAQDDLIITQFDVPRTEDQQNDFTQIDNILKNNDLHSYYIVNYGDFYKVWVLMDSGKPEMKEKLLAKLLPFNTGAPQAGGLKHFELVYGNANSYVLIYRVV